MMDGNVYFQSFPEFRDDPPETPEDRARRERSQKDKRRKNAVNEWKRAQQTQLLGNLNECMARMTALLIAYRGTGGSLVGTPIEMMMDDALEYMRESDPMEIIVE